MKRVQSLLGILCCCCVLVAQDIDYAEYYIDTDPGPGNGTEITGFSLNDTVSFMASIPTNALSLGFHVVAIRVRDEDGIWSIIDRRGFLITTSDGDMSEIVAAEYYLDTDPGQGNGVPITGWASGDEVDFSVSIPTMGLEGFHLVAIRVQDADGVWSQVDRRGFYVSSSDGDMSEVVAAEYYIDTDPGVGNGVPITGWMSGDEVDFSVAIPTTGLEGFHLVAIRVQDADGIWSTIDRRGFYVSPIPQDIAELIEAEYYIDTDPGVGNGVPITGFASGDEIDFSVSVPTTGLEGFHFVAIRAKDADGVWSIMDRRGFYVSPPPVDMPIIVAAEYFLNTDPGPGNGTPLVVDPTGNMITEVFNFNVAENAPLGQNFYAIRVKDLNGTWSLLSYDTVTVAIRAPADVTVFVEPDQCSKVVNNIDPDVLGMLAYNYTLTGATNGSGSGSASGLAFNVGVTTVTYALVDYPGATSSLLVTVLDNQLPSITCPTDVTVSNDGGACGAVVNYTVVVNDNCPGANLNQTTGLPSGSLFPVGTTVNTFIVSDASGNTASCSFSVVVNDTELPTIDCPDNVTVANDAGVCGAIVNYTVTGDDNCPGESIIQTSGIATGGTFSVGITTNIFRVTDASGNSTTCSFAITVNDTELPSIDCPDNVTVSNDPGICGAIVNFSVSFDDNCPGETILQTAGLPSGSTFPIGTTTNTFRATDAVGNSSTCSFTVTVNDTQSPVIDCPDDVTVSNDVDVCGAIVNYSVTFDDNCDGDILSQTMGLSSGSTFPVGTTTNTFMVTDASGNSITCSFTVTVNDTQLPVIDCPDDLTVSNDAGICGAIVNYSVTIDDNCPGQTVLQTAGLASGNTFPIGTTTNTFRVTDASGNSTTCSFTVTVSDTEAPEINCPSNIIVAEEPGLDGAVVNFSVTADDNCTGEIIQQTQGLPSGSLFPIGITTNAFLVTDASGNTETCSFTVTVLVDTECDPPVGTACDDGDMCTIDDAIGIDCNCTGTFQDSDGDGTCDAEDECPDDPNKTEQGICGCGISDDDSDGDGTADCLDGCPDDPNKTDPGICGCGVADVDSDDDGTADCLDGCPDDPNKTDPGICGCGIADTDSDGDGTADCLDGCPDDPDKTDPGMCGCGVSDDDSDGDGTADCLDGCPDDPDKTDPGICGCGVIDDDSDGDGTADCLDGCPDDPDKTDPGICGCGVADDDSDGDGTVDCLDGCPDDPDKTDPGICGCGISDDDTDGDGTADCLDGCPDDPDKTDPGICGCGTADDDTDGDGTADCLDGCPDDPDKTEPGICGCGISDEDSDGDGVEDCNDLCPDGLEPGSPCDDGNSMTVNDVIGPDCICAGTPIECNDDTQCDDGDPCTEDLCENGICLNIPLPDGDGDGTCDAQDGCPDDPNKTEPGICGCGVADDDSDGDGVEDCNDGCPDDPDKTEPGICGCGVSDQDTDGDGVEDCNDNCPDDPDKTEPGDCGCGVSDEDSDGDGTADCLDGCPDDPNKTAPGQCGCGVADTDSDGDGTADCNDECPNDPDKTAPGVCGCGNPEPGTACDDGDPNTVNDVITTNCTCQGEQLGETCSDGIQNGDEEGIDCGGSCAPCLPPVAICGNISVYVNPNNPVYDGPGSNNIWWIPAEDLDGGSTSSSMSPSFTIRRFLNNILFNWTTQGACIDVLPNGVYNNRDQGIIYRDCLPVTNADFNKWRSYQLRIADQFGSDDCYGKVRVIPQVQSYSAPSIHLVIPDIDDDVPFVAPDVEEASDSDQHAQDGESDQLTIVPNPGIDVMQISWHALQSGPGRLRIVDIAGRIVVDQNYEILEGENVLLIDMANAESGLYLVKLNTTSGNRFGKWMKIRN